MPCKLVIGLGISLSLTLLTGTSAAAEVRSQIGDLERQELRGPQEASRALADSIVVRERQRAASRREDVAADVARRAREMGVTAPVALLTDLLLAAADAQLELDRCTVSGAPVAACDAWRAELGRIESRFRDRAGMTAAEFRDGARLPEVPKLSSTWAASGGVPCRCSFQVHSKDRWMNGYWGVECGGGHPTDHSSHGHCPSIPDHDTAWHSAGCGAMTGDVAVSTGLQWIGRACEDDHRTCFKGPGFCGSGEWSAVCSCDTLHWPGKSDGEEHDERIFQFAFYDVTLAGPCGQAQFQIIEGIYENDWGCCRDWMGNLVATFTPPLGPFDLTVPTSATKCGNDGVCGSFGANLQVVGSCVEESPPPPDDPGGGPMSP